MSVFDYPIGLALALFSLFSGAALRFIYHLYHKSEHINLWNSDISHGILLGFYEPCEVEHVTTWIHHKENSKKCFPSFIVKINGKNVEYKSEVKDLKLTSADVGKDINLSLEDGAYVLDPSGLIEVYVRNQRKKESQFHILSLIFIGIGITMLVILYIMAKKGVV